MNKLILPIAILISINLNAQIDTLNQAVISSSGEVFESNSFILNFTLGDFAIETFESNDNILSQGFHQPDSGMVTFVSNISGFGDEIRTYPNPTSNKLILEFQFLQLEEIKISIFDMTGKQLGTDNYFIASGLFTFDVSEYPSGQYLLEITNSDKQKKHTYKIIKQ